MCSGKYLALNLEWLDAKLLRGVNAVRPQPLPFPSTCPLAKVIRDLLLNFQLLRLRLDVNLLGPLSLMTFDLEVPRHHFDPPFLFLSYYLRLEVFFFF